MTSESLLIERMQMVEGFPPVLLNSGANNGDYVSLKNYARVAIVFVSGVGTAGDDPTLTVQQASAVAGTGAKALNINTSQCWKKQAATSLASTGTWSDASGDVSTNTLTNITSAEQALIWWVEFRADQLDVANNFDCIRATVADVGTNAQPGYLFYLLGDPRFAAAAENMPSAIID